MTTHDEEWDMPIPNFAPRPSFAAPVVPPSVDPDGGTLVQVPCIAREWVPFVLGALEQLRLPSTWAVADDDAMLLTLQRAERLRGIIASWGACEVLEFDCLAGVPRYSLDGGATWTALPDCFTGPAGPPGAPGAPGATGATGPPGVVVGPPPDPFGSTVSQQACNIAAYLTVDVIETSITQTVSAIAGVTAIVDLFGGILEALGMLTLVGGIAVIAIEALYTSIQAHTASHYTTAMADATFKSDIQCAIYAAIAADGYVTNANFAAILTNISAVSYTYPEVVVTIHDYVNSLGASGLEALQIAGSLYVGDCSTCGIWCYEWDSPGLAAWAIAPGFGTFNSSTGITSSNNSGAQTIIIDLAISPAKTITRCKLNANCHAAAGGDTRSIRFYHGGSVVAGPFNMPSGAGSFSFDTGVFAGVLVDDVDIVISSHGTALTNVLSSVELFGPGSGSNPFGSNNCTY